MAYKNDVDIDAAMNISKIIKLKDAKEQLMYYVKENQRLVNELRELRHSNINIIHGINGYVELEDWNGLKKYFDDILKRIKTESNTSLSSIEKMLNPTVKELIYSKYKDALSIGINTQIMVDENILIKNNLISEDDLCKVISELWDNAAKAASQAAGKKVSMYVLNDEKAIRILIESTYKEKTKLRKQTVTEIEEESDIKPLNIILSKYPKVLNNVFFQHRTFVQELQILK